MATFINPFTDVGFKRIFGQEFSKPLLIDFLNNLFKGERKIVDLKFLDKEQLGIYQEDRSLIYDVYCELETGEKIIVEMQNCEQPYFKRRSIYYICESIARQGEKGPAWRYNIKAVYLIAFLNFKLPGIGRTFRTDVLLMNRETQEEFTDLLNLVYLQLPYFVKEADDCVNDFERWIYVLKHMETIKRLPWVAQNSIFQRLAEISDLGSLSREERMKYDVALRKYRDTLCVMDGAMMRGLEQGRAEGRAEGREEERMSIARNMKAQHIAISVIASCTGLSEEEIEQLS